MKKGGIHFNLLTRRQFLALGAAAGAVVALFPLAGCGGGSNTAAEDQGLFVYRLSARGRRVSNASKKHNANMLFSTRQAAEGNRAHFGDHSRIVRVNISPARYEALFAIPGREVVDLRRI